MSRFARVLAAAFAAALLAAPAAAASSPDVVISQVYGGGGNAGATYTNDFVELFNRGTDAVDLTGWSVQYASAAGTTYQRTPLTGTIAPGRHYLVQEAVGANPGTPLPTPDATGTIAMSATAGKVQLVTAAAARRDLVGYGSNASEFEGSGPAPGLSNTTADTRTDACADNDDNATEFGAGAPDPHNSGSALQSCSAISVASSDPADGDADVDPARDLTVTFAEPVDLPASAFSLACGGTDRPLDVSGGPDSYTLDPQDDLPRGTSCTLRVHGDGVRDYAATFTTAGLELRIHDIQGSGRVSPVAGDLVSHVPGVVTAVSGNGFWFQDPQPDDDPGTSEGVFVFTSTRPTVAAGDAVTVSGRVSEYRADPANLSTTEIASPRITVTGTGTIAPTIVGQGGRVPPNRSIEDGIAFHESLEGMLVEIRDAVAVGPSVAFGEIPVLADGGAGAVPRTARGGIHLTPQDFNPERLILDDTIAPTPTDVDVRDGLGTVDAVVDYSFGNYKYEVLRTPVRTSGGLTREVTEPPKPQQVAIASFNVENLDPTDPPSKFARLASILVDNLRAPDLVAVEEIQDDDGPGTAPSTDASATWNELVAAIAAAGGPAYQYRQIDPVYGQDGGEPGGNIRQGFLYRTDRGLEFVDRPGGASTDATAEDASQPGAQLTLSPGRIQPQDHAFDTSRKPLAGEFRWKGRPLFVVANHFNSKGGDDPLFGERQPPVNSSEVQRHQQAAIVNAFVRSIEDADPSANVVVLGDLNDFEFSGTVDLLKGSELYDLVDLLAPDERYSYVYDGNSQVLDQILVSPALMRASPQYDSVHVNAEFHDQDSDHDPQVARLHPLP